MTVAAGDDRGRAGQRDADDLAIAEVERGAIPDVGHAVIEVHVTREQRGAELQQRFSAVSEYVPKVFESGSTADYFYIAMEVIAGEDLSQTIHRGSLPWERAVTIAIQLC